MSSPATLSEWIARDAIPLAVDEPGTIDSAIDQVMGELGESVELLGLSEALHGSEEIRRIVVEGWRLPRSTCFQSAQAAR